MKYILLGLALLFSGCASNPFEVTYLERQVCDDGTSTPYANDSKREGAGLYWYIYRTGWHSKAVSVNAQCKKVTWSA